MDQKLIGHFRSKQLSIEERIAAGKARMLTSPFAFLRGGAAIMAADLVDNKYLLHENAPFIVRETHTQEDIYPGDPLLLQQNAKLSR
jgi:hypothetical protein